MTITESKLKEGTLTFGAEATAVSFACQATNVRVTPTYNSQGDAQETLCGDSTAPDVTETWQVQGTSIQDFDSPDGFLDYCYENRLTNVPFTWQANKTGAPTWAGTVAMRAIEEGGDVATRLTADWAFDTVGQPTRTRGTTFAAASADESGVQDAEQSEAPQDASASEAAA